MAPLIHSPPFRLFHTAAIPAGGILQVREGGNDDTGPGAKYAPFNRLFISNFDAQPLDVEYGLGRIIRVPGGVSMDITQPGIDAITVRNAGAVATTQPIEVIWQLAPTTEELLEALVTRAPLEEIMRRP